MTDKEENMKNVKFGVLTILLLLPFYIAYGQEAKQETHEQSPAKEKRVVATVDADGVQRVSITGGEYYFDPNYIVVKVNVPVELKVKKAEDASGFVPHSIVVKAPEAGIDFKESLSKEPKAVRFTPTKVGKYPLYCDKKSPFGKSHREKGMEGVIEVVP
jgi:plastocyanin domain-containing protein